MFQFSHFHPLTVHFPVALIITGFFLDVISLFFNKKEPGLSRAGFYLMILGTLAAVAGYLTGEYFTKEYTGVLGDLKETHELYAKITMFIMIGACLIRIYLVWKKKETGPLKWLVFFLFFVATISVAYTGLLGGTMVYNNMIGIQETVAAPKDSTASVSNATAMNLKSALQGETNASAKYKAFATKAKAENQPQIALLFEAASKSESIHAANHMKVLKEMGQNVAVTADTFTVKSTKENLQAAFDGEKYESETMYPKFIEQADNEDMDASEDAVKTFKYANETEKKHMALYKSAIEALAANITNTLPAGYFVCPICGNTYSDKDVKGECEICSTSREKFISIK
jgi:rubrerythrin/uncharacterized membrane protein